MVDADIEQVNVDFEQVHVYREQSSGFTFNFEHVNVGSVESIKIFVFSNQHSSRFVL